METGHTEHAKGFSSFVGLVGQLRLPVLVAPMFLVSSPQMVIAAGKAGVLGSFPSTNARSLKEMSIWMAQIDRKIGNRWAQNLITHSSYARFDGELDLVEQYQPAVVITALGGPRRVVDRVETYGGIVLADVNSPDFAKRALDQGAHGLALVCSGAGGHTGDYSVFAFLDEVRREFSGPLAVGGGLSIGQAVRALQVYGADLVTLGTRFIACDEAFAVDGYKDMIVSSTMRDVIVTRAFTGAKASFLKPSIVACGLDPDNLDENRQFDMSDTGTVKNWKDIWSAGQGVGHISDRQPLGTIIDQLEHEYRLAIKREADLSVNFKAVI